MFGINGAEFLIILLVAVVVVGPERLPRYAEQLAHLVRNLRTYADGARTRVSEELGPDAASLDWRTLDPRRYDPRRIVRDALLEPTGTGGQDGPPPRPAPAEPLPEGAPPPFDPEAT